jgi:hypothetical protein
MIFCPIFNPSPVYTSLTVTDLTPAGLVKNSAAGLLSTEAFGTASYIPYSSGSGFSYSANLTFGSDILSIIGSLSIPMTSAATLGISIDGETNAYTFGSSVNFNNITRKIVGSGTSQPSPSMSILRIAENWDYDYTGSQSLSGIVRTIAFTNYLDGTIAPTSGLFGGGTWDFYGVDGQCNLNLGIIDSTTKKVNLVQFTGGKFSSTCTSTGTLTQVTNTLSVNFIGGEFSGDGTTPMITGNPTIGFYGGKFTATGFAGGTSTSYGGYFSGTGSDTNYDLYAANTGSLNILAGNTRIGSTVSPTVALDVTGAGLFSTTLGVTGLITADGGISSGNIEPITDDTYYLGRNDDDSPKAWKGIILKDQAGTGKYYRIEISGDALQIVDLTD